MPDPFYGTGCNSREKGHECRVTEQIFFRCYIFTVNIYDISNRLKSEKADANRSDRVPVRNEAPRQAEDIVKEKVFLIFFFMKL